MTRPQILVVEDEAFIAFEIKDRLMNLGYGITGIVFTGEEAIKEAIKNKPDLILMDIQLRGDIDGVEAATKIGQQLNIPVIYLTAHGENAILERAKITEPYGYLIKPFNEIELRSAIEMALYKHEAERKIRESEEKFRELFNKASCAIFIFDLEGHIKEINQEAIDRLKYNRQELLAMKIFDLQPQESIDQPDMIIENIRQQGRIVSEIIQKDRNGKEIPTEYSCNLISYCGKEAILCFARDIRARKKIQEELFKMEKLKSVATLAGGIAHDFNNLLTAILGNISLAQIYVAPGSRVQILMEEAEKACIRVKNLTEQLLTFAHGAEGAKKIIFLNKLIKDTANSSLSGTPVTCQFHLSDSLYPVQCDPNQIGQLIHCLINNSIEAMPYGGTIEVKAENVHLTKNEITPLKQGNYVRISIKDSGWGIEQKNISKVFDPYYSTKERGAQKGMGLGLAIAYSIVKNHRGQIIVDSLPGTGTTFTIHLPASVDKADESESLQQRECVKINKRILVMDDELLVRAVTSKMLEHLGYDVTLSEDVKQVIAMYKEAKETDQPFDAVILDLTIPGGSGGKVAIKELKKIDPHIKAIISSGYTNDPILSTFHTYGFCGAIVKPYSLEKLKISLEEALKENSP